MEGQELEELRSRLLLLQSVVARRLHESDVATPVNGKLGFLNGIFRRLFGER